MTGRRVYKEREWVGGKYISKEEVEREVCGDREMPVENRNKIGSGGRKNGGYMERIFEAGET